MQTTAPAPAPITLQPVGVIRSPHRTLQEIPIQPVYAEGVRGQAELLPELSDGLRDLEGFSHIWLVYWFHRASPPRLLVQPYVDDEKRGIFATRAPCRPNPIGFSVVRLVSREKNVLQLEDVDVLDGTPLLDIKPYITRFDQREDARCGWQDDVDEETARGRGSRRRRGKNEQG